MSEVIAAECLSLPMFAELSGPQIDVVVEALQAALKGAPSPTSLEWAREGQVTVGRSG